MITRIPDLVENELQVETPTTTSAVAATRTLLLPAVWTGAPETEISRIWYFGLSALRDEVTRLIIAFLYAMNPQPTNR